VNRNFDFYEYAGIIVPGSVLVLGFLWLFPEGHAFFAREGVTFGELGIFVIVAYAAGQLVQAIGNGVEWLWWKPWGGMPSGQVLTGRYISADQHKRIIITVQSEMTSSVDVSKLTASDRQALVREIYSAVSGAGKATRVDIFNGNYGLMRGLAAAIISILIAVALTAKGWGVAAGLATMLLLALQRMHRFGRLYAVELFIQFLALQKPI
jgi:hypothetical protein